MTGAAYYMKLPELIDVLGEPSAMKLCEAVGGTRFYVRETIPADSPLTLAVGEEAAQRLADHVATGIGGMWVEIPTAAPKHSKSLRERVLEGTGTEKSIAKEFGVHGRTVRRMRRRIREEAALSRVETPITHSPPGQ